MMRAVSPLDEADTLRVLTWNVLQPIFADPALYRVGEILEPHLIADAIIDEEVRQAGLAVAGVLTSEIQEGADGGEDPIEIPDRGEIDEGDAPGTPRGCPQTDLLGQAGLARAPRPLEGHQARPVLEPGREALSVGLPPEERRPPMADVDRREGPGLRRGEAPPPCGGIRGWCC